MLTVPEDARVETDIQRALAELQYPDFIDDRRIEVGTDASGDTAAWVWLLANERYTGDENQRAKLDKLRERIRESVAATSHGLWAYIRLERPEGTVGEE